jgi:hypothetical protein
MSARDIEQAMIRMCRDVACAQAEPQGQDQANVCRVAGMIVRIRYPAAGARLFDAAARYFAAHPEQQLPSQEVVLRGWLISLPRLRDQLERLLPPG